MHALKPTKQKFFKTRLLGFDIETYDKNKKFNICSIVGYDRYNNKFEKTYYSKEEFIADLKTNMIFRNCWIVATNLSFDFFGIFFGHEDIAKFHYAQRGSGLLFAKTYFEGNDFTAISKRQGSRQARASLTFIDTMNYSLLSVEKLGGMVNLPKLKAPVFETALNDMSQTDRDYMIQYNLRDSWISHDFMKFFIETVEKLGATVKITIASTSLSLFKNKFLKQMIGNQNMSEELLNEIFESYFGGRTEVFQRGLVKDVDIYSYDYNSLYPSVMAYNEYPDPNSQRISYKNNPQYIMNAPGCSKITIKVPYSKYTNIPKSHNNKLLFGYGTFTGTWVHPEILIALKNGAKILKVHKSIYYMKTCKPFVEFVNFLWKLRLKYKAEKSPMEKIVKIMMNSLYGKFCEKFEDKPVLIHKDVITMKEIDKAAREGILIDKTSCNQFFIFKEKQKPKAHCIPIWGSYVSAYGRIKLFNALIKHKPIYCDTDSLVTTDIIKTSNKLGDFKLEHTYKEFIAVRPKFYSGLDIDGTEVTKIKGIAKKLTHKEFKKLVVSKDPAVTFTVFTKFKSALRRKFIPNELREETKHLNLEDNKRDWEGIPFSLNLQDSKPLHIVENLKVNNNPTINNGANNIGEVAPIKK